MANFIDRYAVVGADGIVSNVIIWKGDAYLPGTGNSLVYNPVACKGDIFDFDTLEFTKPE